MNHEQQICDLAFIIFGHRRSQNNTALQLLHSPAPLACLCQHTIPSRRGKRGSRSDTQHLLISINCLQRAVIATGAWEHGGQQRRQKIGTVGASVRYDDMFCNRIGSWVGTHRHGCRHACEFSSAPLSRLSCPWQLN